jgi:hypothetical protein
VSLGQLMDIRKQHALLVIYDSGPITGLAGPLGLEKVEAPRLSRHSAQEFGKVVGLKNRPFCTPGDILGTHFCYKISQP